MTIISHFLISFLHCLLFNLYHSSLVIIINFVYLICCSKRSFSSADNSFLKFEVSFVEGVCETSKERLNEQLSISSRFRKLLLGLKTISSLDSLVFLSSSSKGNVFKSWFIILNRDPSQLQRNDSD